jgi:hypothetical protein
MSDPKHSGVRLTKLAGPGVEGLEYDPPLFHLDVRKDRFRELIADPVRFLRSVGLGAEDGVAPDDEMTVRFTGSRWQWNGSRWESRQASDLPDAGDNAGTDAGHSCCYISGPDEMTCHWHDQDPHTDTVFVND